MDDRKRKHADWDGEPKDDKELPWDVRGPPEGGPEMWRSQKYPANTGANAGGRHREKYELWRHKFDQGLTGNGLAFFHPLTKDGQWDQECKKLGIKSPREEKKL